MASNSFKLGELAKIVGGELCGDNDIEITGVAGIKEAKLGDITFLANPKYEEYLDKTGASAVIGSPGLESQKPLIRIENPYLAFLKVITLFTEDMSLKFPRGVHDSAIVDPTAKLGDKISVGPCCQIRKNVRVGDNTTIIFGVFIGDNVTIGNDCLIYPNVTIRENAEIGDRVILHPGAVIGSDGFGFAKDGPSHQKIPQIGRVIIEDDVEIGANSAVDRATTGITRVCKGSKIDNLVQIAHNVKVGENSIIAAQTGISGSTELGKNVVLAGQAGLVGHIKIGDNVMIGAQAGVTKSIPPNTKVSGYPAREHEKAKKLYAYTAKLPELFQRLRALEAQLEVLEGEVLLDKTTKNDQ